MLPRIRVPPSGDDATPLSPVVMKLPSEEELASITFFVLSLWLCLCHRRKDRLHYYNNRQNSVYPKTRSHKAQKPNLQPLNKVRSGANHGDGVGEWRLTIERGDKGDGD